MKLRDLKAKLRSFQPDEFARYSTGVRVHFPGSYREGEHVINGVDPGSGESSSYLQVVDGSGHVLSITKLPPGHGRVARVNHLDKPAHIEPYGGTGRHVTSIHAPATEEALKAGRGLAPGVDLSAAFICDRPSVKPEMIPRHDDCTTVQPLGRSLGTMFAMYWRDGFKGKSEEEMDTLKDVFWGDRVNTFALLMLDAHSAPKLVRIAGKQTSFPEDVTQTRVCVDKFPNARDDRYVKVSAFNLYPVETTQCECATRYPDIIFDPCGLCDGHGLVWAKRFHPSTLVPVVRATSAPVSISVSLHTSDPDARGESEASYTGYARVPIKRT